MTSERNRDQDDAQLAIRIAEAAAASLRGLRDTAPPHPATIDAGALRAAGDAETNVLIGTMLRNERPADAILSEESPDSDQRLSAERVWIIDPLDGTREYGERDEQGIWRDDFAVHVALWERGRGLTVGAVSLPARNITYTTANPLPLPRASSGTLRVAASRTRPPEFLARLRDAGRIVLVPMGSAGVKAMAVLDGSADAYIHAGGQYQWDSAAPVAVACAAGAVATRLNGEPIVYNGAELLLPDLVVVHPSRAAEVRALLVEAVNQTGGAGASAATGAESPA